MFFLGVLGILGIPEKTAGVTGCLGFWFWETNKPRNVLIQSTCYTCKNLKELTSVSDASLLDLLAPITTLKYHIDRVPSRIRSMGLVYLPA